MLQKNIHRGVVTVNGRWERQAGHIHSFLNPCLTGYELQRAREEAKGKRLTSPMRLLYVGRVEAGKGILRAVEIVRRVRQAGIPADLDVVGDGPERAGIEAGVDAPVRTHGWLNRQNIEPLYRAAHFLLLPTASEGWPKVLSEGMAYGALPLAGNVGSIGQHLAEFATGAAFDPSDLNAFTRAIADYHENPGRWAAESERAKQAAELFSYARYLEAVRQLLSLHPTHGQARDCLNPVPEGSYPNQ
jgi:glycosyltransferase involved in cell wall biosynthesis